MTKQLSPEYHLPKSPLELAEIVTNAAYRSPDTRLGDLIRAELYDGNLLVGVHIPTLQKIAGELVAPTRSGLVGANGKSL